MFILFARLGLLNSYSGLIFFLGFLQKQFCEPVEILLETIKGSLESGSIVL